MRRLYFVSFANHGFEISHLSGSAWKYKRCNLVPGFGNLVGLLFFCVFFYGTLKKMRKPKEAEYTRKRGCRYVCD